MNMNYCGTMMQKHVNTQAQIQAVEFSKEMDNIY